MRIFADLDEFAAAKGEHLGHGDWHTVTQEQVDRFADATGDHQWIHVDPEAAAQGPFGTTVAHGYLTLSLLPAFMYELLSVTDARVVLNYGSDRIRFTAPVPSGSEVPLHARMLSQERRGDGILCRTGVQVEIRGQERPALVGEVLSLFYG